MTDERTAPRRRNPRGQGETLKAELVEAAARLLATLDRPETLTLRQVAREVGVAPASIYSHFPDLGALIRHVLRLRYEELARLMDDAAASATGPLADLVARCATYAHWGVAHPGEYGTLIGGRMPTELVPLTAHGAGEELLGSVIASLASVRQRTARSVGPEPSWQAGLLLWTALHGLVALYNDHGNLPWPPLNDLITDTLSLHTGEPAAEIAKLVEAVGPSSGHRA
ncbi:TetR/AcrR family transcriptional regulator [Streptomyces sp. NPDC100445]|uniref:TetR/AcrR family transcriptional regulator n=1 Tax=Streptomyces sp. NPDC100445 TaxID=3366102 RepID=UPI0037F168B6